MRRIYILKKPTLFLILCFFFLILTTRAQEKEPGLELVVSGLVMYTPKEELFDASTEIHLTYWVSHRWAFGIGYTLIFEEENTVGHEIAGLTSYKPSHFLTVNFGPSFSIPNSERDLEVAAYIESEFNFKIGEFHVGPLIGTLIGEEFRLFSGIHLGYDF
ncbi:hypothetical protein [Aquimarina sp. 2201CG14-23]|uniref:hypothetical protein n=1 Tax=Aquimarina mycalae TaxID=3040073 RepID=UPI002477F06B|nr:hypothetical protein [Aquimarina sp. 2201CG14-23]MDH7447913.1 hypothetical protein [Aquimarina sp. 2201CG14-23]